MASSRVKKKKMLVTLDTVARRLVAVGHAGAAARSVELSGAAEKRRGRRAREAAMEEKGVAAPGECCGARRSLGGA